MCVRRVVVFAAFALAASGCSLFNRDWENAKALHSQGLGGRWSGTWTSETTGHHGKLRCIAVPQGENVYEARFHATYCGILPFQQTVRLTTVDRGGLWRFRGEEDLGWLAGGIYTYEGETSGERFMARYTSVKDRGVFEMSRPK